jgi:hypothetical protein
MFGLLLRRLVSPSNRVACFAALVTLASAPAARAYWNAPSELVLGTSQTLEQGEVLIGILMPAAYGVTDSVMVTIHPINWALLTPNAGLRWRIYDSETTRLAITFSGAGTVVGEDESVKSSVDRPIGHITGTLGATFELGGGFLLTGLAGYQRDFNPSDDDLIWNAAVHWLITESSLLILQGGFQFGLGDQAIKTEQVTLAYVHAWEVIHLSVGVTYGNFPVALVNDKEITLKDVPIWPVLDVFWRF